MDRWIQNVNYLGNRYSYRRASTGLAVAAWMVWTLTVSKAIIKATTPANTKVKLWSLGIRGGVKLNGTMEWNNYL
jgi:hypothetical protein